jgi:hypothetical protein
MATGRIGFVLIAVLPALAACGPGPAAGPAANEAAPVRDPAATARAAAPAGPGATPALAPLTADGWGPLRIGMTLDEVAAAAGPDADPDAPGGAEPEACDTFHPARAPEGLRVMVERGRLTRISIAAPTAIRTDRGLGPGDSAQAVREAYRDRVRASPHEYDEAPAEYLTSWTTDVGVEPYVQAAAARGIRYEVDRRGRVAQVHAGGPSIQYVEGCS